MFQSLATELVSKKNRRARHSLHNGRAINDKSTIALRGIVLEALRDGDHWVVLDHFKLLPQRCRRILETSCSTAARVVLAVARSAHMEDLGFLARIFVLGSERIPLPNFGRSEARRFAEENAQLAGLLASELF